MKTRIPFLLPALAVLATTAHAQGGCVNSPENPTLILGLVGGAAAAASCLRGRIFPKR